MISILVIIIILVSSFLIYRKIDIAHNTMKIGMIKNQTIAYLKDKTGCSEDMYNLKVEYHFQNKFLGYNPYVIKVIFKDEQNVIYYYNYIKGRITEQGISPMQDKEDKNFKHAVK